VDDGVNAQLFVAGLLRRDGRGLLLHRSALRRSYPDSWDLPGGHVEDGEPPEAALRRALLQQIDVTAVVGGEPFAQVNGATFRTLIWAVEQWDADPVTLDASEHDALAWLNHREMAGLRLADPRLPALFEAALC
jgi:8-oxo-dGTP diphosphatase